MKQSSDQQVMRPLDVAVLLKISTYKGSEWKQQALSEALHLSQSEVSKSVARSKYAGLLDESGKKARKNALLDFLGKGLAYVFPQRPGELIRGIPTSHSAPPLSELIRSNKSYVWPFAKGKVRGQAIFPLYPGAPEAALEDQNLYVLLTLVDALRVGSSREKKLAFEEMEKRLLNEK